MKKLKPSYYDRFSCTGSRCLYHCCQGWQIIIDKHAEEKYRNYTGTLKEMVEKGLIYCEEHKFWKINLDENGQCPCLDEQGLCEIVKQRGPEDLSGTCTIYPRTSMLVLDVMEYNLSIACPEVVSFLYQEKGIMTFVEEDDGEEIKQTLAPEVQEAIQIDLWIRDKLIDCLQMREYPLWYRKYVTLQIVENITKAHNEGNVEKIATVIGQRMGEEYMRKNYEMLCDITWEDDKTLKFGLLQQFMRMIKSSLVPLAGKDNHHNDEIMQAIYRRNDAMTIEEYRKMEEDTAELLRGMEIIFEHMSVILTYEEELKAFNRCYIRDNYNYIMLLELVIRHCIQLYYQETGAVSEEKQQVIISMCIRLFIHSKVRFVKIIEELQEIKIWSMAVIPQYLKE